MRELFRQVSERIEEWWDRLTGRERTSVVGLCVVLVVLLLGGGIYWSTNALNKNKTQLRNYNKQVAEILSLEGGYRQSKIRTELEERRIRSNTLSLFSLMQGIATRLGLTLKDLNEQKRPLKDTSLVEYTVVLNLKELSIDKLTAFLRAVEESPVGDLVKVIRLKAKARFDAPDLLDVQMTVATWKSA